MKSKHGFETTSERSELMRKIRSKNTRPEIALRKLLWNSGLRYRKNISQLPGSPDLVILKHKIAVFIDGEFWHGYKWEDKRQKLKANKDYWIPKIEKNMVRDKETNKKLEYLGYRVIRFWQHEIEQNPAMCFLKVMEEVERNNNQTL